MCLKLELSIHMLRSHLPVWRKAWVRETRSYSREKPEYTLLCTPEPRHCGGPRVAHRRTHSRAEWEFIFRHVYFVRTYIFAPQCCDNMGWKGLARTEKNWALTLFILLQEYWGNVDDKTLQMINCSMDLCNFKDYMWDK